MFDRIRQNRRARGGDSSTIFCDFDGTITVEDVVDQLLDEYASSQWRSIETLWEKGLIGSRECLERQIACIGRFTQADLQTLISRVHIDMSFIPFIDFIQTQQIPFYIVSDGFDLIIRAVLEKYEIRNIPIFCNHMNLTRNRLNVSFPLSNPDCDTQAGLCKCRVLRKVSPDSPILYIGDGRSDLCASRNATTLFAKGKLLKHCQDEGRPCVPFESFDDVMCEVIEEGKMHVTEDSYVV